MSPAAAPPAQYFGHRSGIEEFWRCPRASYLGYHYLETGITQYPRSVWLDVGIAVHIGLAALIQVSLGTTSADSAVRQAINNAVDWFRNESGQHLTLPNYTFEEQAALVEALLWSFALYTLPAFLTHYRVIWVEREIIRHLESITLMSRPDALVQDRLTNEVAVISWKTIDSVTDFRRRFYKHDLQGLMEMGFARQLLKDERERCAQVIMGHPNAPESVAVNGTKMEGRIKYLEKAIAEYRSLPSDVDYVQTIFLQKGKRKKTEQAEEGTSAEGGPEFGLYGDYDEMEERAPGTGGMAGAGPEGAPKWTQDSFLVYPWVLSGETKTPGSPPLAWKWRYRKPGNTSMSTLGPSYKRALVTLAADPATDASSPVENWIRALNNNRVFPSGFDDLAEPPLSKVIIWEDPCYRQERMLQRVLKQVEMSEERRVDRVSSVQEYVAANGYDSNFESLLDNRFPQHLISCSNPWRCQFQPICFGPEPQWGMLPDGYQYRVPHHTPELENFIERGLVQIQS